MTRIDDVDSSTGATAPPDLAGGYRVELLGPHRWRLALGEREISVHATASEARSAARRAVARRHHGRRALAHLGVMAFGLLLTVAGLPFKDITNPAAARARVFADRMDVAYDDVVSGRADLSDFTVADDGFAGAEVTLGGVGNMSDAPVAVRNVLVGAFEGDCYVVRWSPGGPVATGVLAPDLACEPGPALASVEAYATSSLSTMTSPPIWEGVLPPATTRARWYLPAVLAGVLLAIDGFIGATVAWIRRSRG